MKNIQKIADEIFKAPTEEELAERWMIDENRKEPKTLQDVVELAKYVFSPYRVISGGYYETVEDVKIKKPNTIQIILLAGEAQKEWERFVAQNLKIVSYKVIKYWAKKLNFKIEFKENIKKRAEEIFKAPSREELFERALKRQELMNPANLYSYLSVFRSLDTEAKEKVMKLFPNGAVSFVRRQDTEFDLIESMLDQHWELLSKKQAIGSVFTFRRTKINDRNAVVYVVNVSPYEIFVEAK